MSAFRQWENDLRGFLQSEFVRRLVSLYVEKNPEAADDPDLVMHAIIWPLCLGVKHPKERGGWSEQDSWRGFEHLLLMGATKGGVRLSPVECKFLLQVFSGERKPPTWRGRQAHKRALLRSHVIAELVELLEADEWPTEAAVEHVKEVSGVAARATVFAAKKKRREMFESTDRTMTAENRQKWIEFYKGQAAGWRRPKHPRRSKSNLKPR
jgi:hypothetical protein